jgi:hypothetical protein
MMNLPPDLEVLEKPAGGDGRWHLRLPPRTMPGVKLTGYGGLFAAAFLAGIPTTFAVLAWTFFSNASPSFRWIATAMPLVFFGPLFFPPAVYIFIRVMVLHFGRIEIICEPQRIAAIHRWGRLHWTRRFPVAELRGLRVNTDRPFNLYDPAFSQQLSQLGRLNLDFTANRSYILCWGYPAEWLALLGNGLTDFLNEQRTAKTQLAPLTLEDSDPAVVVEREHQPSSSNAVVTETIDGLEIDLPSRGAWRPEYLGLICACFGVNLFLVFFGCGFLPALFAGQAQWVEEDKAPVQLPIWLGLLLLSPFYALGLGLIVLWWQLAHRSARLVLDATKLHVLNRNTWSTFADSVAREDIQAIRVINHVIEGEATPQQKWEHVLYVGFGDDKGWTLFHVRPKSEVEWLATLLRTRVIP